MPSFWLEHEEHGQTRDFSFQSTTVSIGRDKASDFVLDHPTVSRKHAVIAYKHGSFYLVVLSRSGLTAIDGQPVQGEVLLYDSSVLHVGQLEFRFRSDDAPLKPAAPAHSGGMTGGASGLQGGFGAAVNTPVPQAGFGQTPGFGQAPGLGQPQGFGQAPGLGQPQGFGQAPGLGQPQGFGQAPGMGDAPGLGQQQGMGGFGSPLSAGLGQAGGAPQLNGANTPAPKKAGDAGASWDQIANSSEAMLDASGAKQETIHDRLNSSKKEEKTNPVLILVAGAAILGLVYFSFFSGGGDQSSEAVQEIPVLEQTPVEINVSCLGQSACVQRAEQAYKVGTEKIQQKTVAIPNLFEGYKKLLEAEAYLAKAGDVAPPASMAGLAAKKDATRAELNTIWTNYRVGFAKAKKRNEYREMARQLTALQDYFPDRTARENRWSTQQAQKMKEDGIYPKRF
ncbi:FHA domain-containing protein [Bradymonas sediminis]|uniref:Uncharacterized protein n=1 Tax=Bradymonas sediminis TaxID=1548548 RepID=A0A2Z4FGT1_9DELT|nr:FHA domain-containing protein [Bradymonas sediminis]AWV87925.1 hypothetical protein DN745_00705 [Bradymonas sediminis]TDP62943.1 GANP (Germinal centre-Associated Nuclear Protein)-like protein [Bradymonas sediminis]